MAGKHSATPQCGESRCTDADSVHSHRVEHSSDRQSEKKADFESVTDRHEENTSEKPAGTKLAEEESPKTSEDCVSDANPTDKNKSEQLEPEDFEPVDYDVIFGQRDNSQDTPNRNWFITLYEGTTFLRLFLFMLAGILLYNSCRLPYAPFVAALVAGFGLLTTAAFTHRAKLFVVGLDIFLVGFGAVISYREMPPKLPHNICRFQITSEKKEKKRWCSYDAEVLLDDGSKAKIVVNMLDSTTLLYGAEYRSRDTVDVRLPYAKKHGFNYRQYLLRHDYSGILYLRRDDLYLTDKPNLSLDKGFTRHNLDIISGRAHRFCKQRFREAGMSKQNIELLSAVVLGEKGAVSPDMKRDFQVSGVAHILVVSGMHIGLIFGLIIWCLGFLPRKLIGTIAGLLLLWTYACFTGLAPSVCRATFMYSILFIFKVAGEQYHSISALAISAIVLTLINPLIVYDTGFQMSYTAVLSIALFMPAIPKFNNLPKLPRKLYSVVRVSIAAQILIAPLAMYNFHQFPTYFLLTNLCIVLLLPAVFGLGLFAIIPFIGKAVGWILNGILSFISHVVSFVAALPYSAVTYEPTVIQILALYVMLLLVLNVIRSRCDFRSMVLMLSGLIASTVVIKAELMGWICL